MANTIITEDNVSKHILSFTRDSFLFTRTVCKVWHENGAETNTQTHANRAVDSISTFDQACEHGYPSNVYAPYLSVCPSADRGLPHANEMSRGLDPYRVGLW